MNSEVTWRGKVWTVIVAEPVEGIGPEPRPRRAYFGVARCLGCEATAVDYGEWSDGPERLLFPLCSCKALSLPWLLRVVDIATGEIMQDRRYHVADLEGRREWDLYLSVKCPRIGRAEAEGKEV